MQVVWFKRDLRIHDHAPLTQAARAAAEAGQPLLALYIYEPEVCEAADFSRAHLGFINESLASLDASLRELGSALICQRGETVAVLSALHRAQPISALWSHEETGNAITFARDLRVLDWAKRSGVAWHEFTQTGVVRRLKDRNRWSGHWMKRMSTELISPPVRLPPRPASVASVGLQDAKDLGLTTLTHAQPDKPLRQRGGRDAAESLLISFLDSRGQFYRREMSSPLSAESACSRLSPHFAHGTLSIKEAAQALWAKRDALQGTDPAQRPEGLLASLKSFEGRLHWHCHFMQKLESEPAIEFRNVHRGFDGLREGEFNAQQFRAWAYGETGFPMVDACMRMLAHTGWLNFRMRAMVVSFASYQLWLHWRETALHLAREFVDYESGIHYPQIQMQSGVTGINTIRMYNPVKQAQDHDPEGIFVRRWIPALARVPAEHIFMPWLMPPMIQAESGCVIGRDYPAPIVDNTQAMREAREKIWQRKGLSVVRAEAQKVYEKHGSRNPAREGVKRRTGPRAKSASAQGNLDL